MNIALEIFLYAIAAYVGLIVVFYFIQEKLLFVPKHISDLKPFRFASDFEEVDFKTSNDGSIHGICFRVAQPKGIILYLHGNTGNLKRWGYMGEELLEFGYDVLVIDYRGYGKSVGKRTEEILHQDVLDVFDQIKAKNKYKKHIVYGRSLGTGFAIRLAAKREVDLVILEAPYYSMLDVAYTNFPFLPMRLLLKYKINSYKYIDKIKCPVIIFHGTKDKIVRYKSGIKLYEAGRQKADITLVTLVGGRHNNLNKYPKFRDKLKAVLE